MAATEPMNYDQAARQYAAHRQLHMPVFHELCRHAKPGPNSVVLELGCGTGNYIRALSRHARCTSYGLDPSEGMLSQAQAHSEPVCWIQGRAENLVFAQNSFGLIFSVDVIHHVGDRGAFFREVMRTLRPGGWICTVTDSESIIRRREILSGYFPETVEMELARYPRIVQLEAWMAEAGLVRFAITNVEEPYEVTSALPFRDKAYSSLHLISEEAWKSGLERLERDMARGPVRGTSRCACVWGQKVS